MHSVTAGKHRYRGQYLDHNTAHEMFQREYGRQHLQPRWKQTLSQSLPNFTMASQLEVAFETGVPDAIRPGNVPICP